MPLIAVAHSMGSLIVLPSWRDLNAASDFIANLFRRPLPPFVHHDLLYAFQDLAGYLIRTNGRYLMALTDGTLVPFNPEEKTFVEVARGQRSPRSSAEQDWLRFRAEHPELRDVP